MGFVICLNVTLVVSLSDATMIKGAIIYDGMGEASSDL